MSNPPPGYDDESTIPRSRLKLLLGEFETELNAIQRLFAETVPAAAAESSHDFTAELWGIQETAGELGEDYSFLINKLIQDYENFKVAPDSGKLEQLFSDVKSLQLLLAG